MQFLFDEDQLLLQATLRSFLEKECTPEGIRALWETETGRSAELWQKLAELGLPGLRVAEEHGGLGFGEVDLVLLLEEAGRAALAEPLTATAAVAAPLLVELGDEALSRQWLPQIAAGRAIVAVSHPVCPFVADAHVAQLLLLPEPGAAEGAHALYAVAPEAARITPQPANDPSRRMAQVDFEPASAQRIAEGARARALLDAALDRGALACAAQALGVTDRLIEMAATYSQQRQQFGRPIGSFQAVKHRLADAKVRLEYARPLVYRAAHSLTQYPAQAGAQDPPLEELRGLHVSMAKLAACEAARYAAKAALQTHGAIGYTWEQDLHIWMRRAWSLEQEWGRSSFHLDRLRRALLAGKVPLGPGNTFLGDA